MTSAAIDERFVSLTAPSSFEAEQYRLLRHVVEHMRRESGLQVVAVTSPAVGDGKTTTTINLAGALAQARDTRILLVDIDLRRGNVVNQLQIRSDGLGLADLIADRDATLADGVRCWPDAGLDVVGAGRVHSAPWDLLKSPRLGELLQDARRRYDWVLLDTPPLIPVPDCRVIAKWIDAFLVVVAAHQTPRRMLAEALDGIEPSKLAGLIFNRDDRPAAGSYRYYGGYITRADPHRAWWRRSRGA